MSHDKHPARFSVHILASVGLIVLLAAVFILHTLAQKRIEAAHDLRHRSLLLADELRQSGDDLTRMVRSYVATSEPAYKQHFQAILNIRDGRKPRPENYWRPYWILMLPGGPAPRPDSSQSVPLLELMRQAGFTEEEFSKLAMAKANSDALTLPEFEALKLVEATGPEAEANRAKASRLLFDNNYHRAKISVMQPIDDFLVLVDTRTIAAVQSAELHATVLRYLFIATGLGLLFMLWRTYAALRGTLGGSVDEVAAEIARIGRGDFSGAIQVKRGLENSVLGWLSATQVQLNESAHGRNEAEKTRSRLAAIVQSSDDAIISETTEGIITSWNRGAEKIFGYAAEEAVGRPALLVFPADRGGEEAGILVRIRRGEGVSHFETVRVRKDGKLIDVSLTVSPLKDDSGTIIGASTIARDITEQRGKEEELRRSEARFRSLVTATAQIVWNASAEGKVSGPLPSWQEYTGQTEEEVQDIGWTRALHPDDVPHTMAVWIKAVETRSLYEVDYRIRRHDGVYRLFTGRGAPVLNDDGSVREWVGTCADITDKRQAELERDRFFSLSLDPLCIAKGDGYFHRLNPAFKRILGFSVEEMLVRPFMDFIHPDDRASTMAVVEQLATGAELVNFENRYLCKDGSYRWFLWMYVPSGGFLYATARDITDRKQAEAEIRELNTKLEQRVIERTTQLAAAHAALQEERTLIDAIREAQNQFIVAESSTKIFDGLLASLLKLTGSEYGFIDELLYDAEGKPYLTARAITDISWNEETRKLYPQFLTGELRFTNLKSLFGEVMTTGKPVIANDAPRDPRRGGCPMGHPALSAFLGLPLHAGEDLVGVIGLANRPGGYSEAVLAYLEPMVKACANLIAAQRNEARRQQAEKELQRLLGELEAANKELEAFSYSVSHDLRAPLRGIDSFSRMVIEDYGPKLDAEGQRQLNVIRSEAQRMGQLIDELLKFSQLGRQEVRSAHFDMNTLVQSVFDELPASARERVGQFKVHPLPDAYGDRAMVRQVLVNLIANAVKFSSKVADPVIEISGETVDGSTTYRVKDNGVGFDPRYAHKLFGVFQRLHAEHEFEGTGVGLAIVQRVVHRHGGTVSAVGSLDHGATFSFTLPANNEPGKDN